MSDARRFAEDDEGHAGRAAVRAREGGSAQTGEDAKHGDDARPWWLVGNTQGGVVFVRAATRRRAAATYRYALYDSFVAEGLPASVACRYASDLAPLVWEGPLSSKRTGELEREEARLDRSWGRAESTIHRIADYGHTTP
jgi:hypothetical protein